MVFYQKSKKISTIYLNFIHILHILKNISPSLIKFRQYLTIYAKFVIIIQMEDFMAKKSNLDSPISRVRNASQEVEKDVKTIRGEKRVVKVSQSIKLESANVKFTERGEQYLYSSDSNDYLLKFHKNGKLIASFYEKNGKTYLHFGEEFFKAIDKEGKYAKYHGKDVEISKIVLDKKLDVQVKSTNGEDFSCLLSALGMQIVDKENGNSVFRNTDYPLDVSVSNKFLERALGNDNTCNLGEGMKFESATMQALLIAATQNARIRMNQTIKTNNILDNIKRVQPIELKLGALSLTSLPIRVPKDKKTSTEWLNIAEKDGKLYCYFNLEVNGRKQVGKYYEVRGMTFENNNLSLKLHAGNKYCSLNMDLKGTGKIVQKFLESKEKEYADVFKKFEGTNIDRYDEAKIYSYSEIAVVKRTEKGNELVEEKEPEVLVEDERYNATTQLPDATIDNSVFEQYTPEETSDLENQENREIQENNQVEPKQDNDLNKKKENFDSETTIDGAYVAGAQIIDDIIVENSDGSKQNFHVVDGELEEDNQSGLVPSEKETPQNYFGDAENDREREPEPTPREPVPPEPKPHEHDDDDDSGDNEPNHEEQDLTPPVPPHETPDPPHENPDPLHENPDPSPRQEAPSGNGAPSAQQTPKSRGGSGGGSAGGGGGASAPKEVNEEKIWASFLGVSAFLTALSVFIPFLAPFAIAGFATSAILYTKPWNWGNTPLAKAMDARARRKELEKEDRQLERESKLERLESDKARYQQEIESIDQILPQLEEELAVLQNGNGKVLTDEERQEKQQKIAEIDNQIKSEEEEISEYRNIKIKDEDEYIKANKLVLNYSEMLEKSKNELLGYHNQEEELTNLQKNVNSILNDKNLSEEEIEKLKQETLNAIQAKYKKAFNDIFSENTEKAKKALDAFAYKTDFDKRVLQSVQENRRGIIRDIESNLNNAKEVEKRAKAIYEKSTIIEKIIKKHETKITILKDDKAKIQSELTVDAVVRGLVPELERTEAITNVEKQIDSLKKRKETLQKAVKISEQMEYGLRPEDMENNYALNDRWKNTGPSEKAMEQLEGRIKKDEIPIPKYNKAQKETKAVVMQNDLRNFAQDIMNRAEKAKQEQQQEQQKKQEEDEKKQEEVKKEQQEQQQKKEQQEKKQEEVKKEEQQKKEQEQQQKKDSFTDINKAIEAKEEEIKKQMGDSYNNSKIKSAFDNLRKIVENKQKEGKTNDGINKENNQEKATSNQSNDKGELNK